MTGARVIFAIGLFGVPLILLALGHALRKRSPRQRAAFWGGVTGYGVGVLLMSIITVIPPIHWEGGAVWRDVLVHWSMVLGTLVGFGLGVFLRKGTDDRRASSERSDGQRSKALI